MKIETAVPVRPLAPLAASLPSTPTKALALAEDAFSPAPAGATAVAAPTERPLVAPSLRGFTPSVVHPCDANSWSFEGTLSDGKKVFVDFGIGFSDDPQELEGWVTVDGNQIKLTPEQMAEAVDGITATSVMTIHSQTTDGTMQERTDIINRLQSALRPFAGFKPTEVYQCGDYSYDIGGTLPDGKKVWVIAVLDEQGNAKVDEFRFMDDGAGERVLTRDEIADLLAGINKNQRLQVEDMVDGNTNADGRKTMIQRLQAALG